MTLTPSTKFDLIYNFVNVCSKRKMARIKGFRRILNSWLCKNPVNQIDVVVVLLKKNKEKTLTTTWICHHIDLDDEIGYHLHFC